MIRTSRITHLHRDLDHGWVCGVCAGLARYFNVDRKVVRALTVFGLIFFLWPVLIAYFVAAALLPRRGQAKGKVRAHDPEPEFETETVPPAAPVYVSEVEEEYDELEQRLRGLEAYLASKDLELSREFRNLERNAARGA